MRTTDAVAKISFYSYKTGAKRDGAVQYSVDCTGMRDPIGQLDLKKLKGDDPKVVAWIKADPRVDAIIDSVNLLIHNHVGKTNDFWLSIGFHDPKGSLIAPAVCEAVARTVEQTFTHSISVDHHHA